MIAVLSSSKALGDIDCAFQWQIGSVAVVRLNFAIRLNVVPSRSSRARCAMLWPARYIAMSEFVNAAIMIVFGGRWMANAIHPLPARRRNIARANFDCVFFCASSEYIREPRRKRAREPTE